MAELDKILQKYVGHETDETEETLGVVRGAAFIVKDKQGKTLYSNAFGKLNFDASSPPFTADSVGWIASMTKLLTCVCVMQLVETGKVGLDADLGKIIPQLSNMEILDGFDKEGKPVMGKQTKPITLRELLSHSSGLSYLSFDPVLIQWATAIGRPMNSATFTLEDITLPLKFQPGDGWTYGVGIDWAGHLVEVLTGQTLGEYMEEHMFKPLGMASSTFHIADRPDLAERRAAMGMRGIPGQPLVSGADPLAEVQPKDSGGAGLYSTANDYAMVLGELVKDGGRLLKPDTYRELLTPQLPDNKYLMGPEVMTGPYRDLMCPEYPVGLPANYALGGAINLKDVPGKRKKGSMMWSGMSNPHWWIDPESGITATLFTQVLPPGDKVVIDLYDELERAVYGGLVA